MTQQELSASARVRELIARMSPEEKVAQLGGYWIDQGDEVVAPMADELVSTTGYEEASRHGIGHLTRVYGTRPVDPITRADWLWGEQRRLREQTRLGIPAIVHEECLTGLAAWKAATYPTPLAWGASFDPDAVAEMARLIGGTMRQLGIHQGLAPVLDVIRDPRWGRVDECIAEDPYVVATIGTAYVRGLQDAGVDATLKHFVGYSASRAGRNHAPVAAGPREIADVLLPPFEMAVRDGGARSVMNSYAEIDGMPVAASTAYLTDLLRGQWGFEGVVVADYFAVQFLQTMHAVAASPADAARLALTAGVDVELPSAEAFAGPLLELMRTGGIQDAVIDRAVARVLSQKERLGLLDEEFERAPRDVDLDGPAHRAMARRLAEESAVLLSNDGLLPLQTPRRIAAIGPNAASAEALMGCYSFANHVLAHHPGVEFGFRIPTVLEALRAQFPAAEITHTSGCDVEGEDRSRIPAAVRAATAADVAIVVVGDRAGLFGRGTVGEGNDVESLDLPGVQRELIEAVAATGTPVVLVLLTGRPYAIDFALDRPGAPGAVLQSFFPGEEGASALAAIIAGDVAPSGRLPVSLPRSAGSQPYSYLHPILGGPTEITSASSAPVRPFGFGLTYTSFTRSDLRVDAAVDAGQSFRARVRVRNDGERDGTDVVQLYARDVYASVTRPVAQLLGYARVEVESGAEVDVEFEVPTTRLAFTSTAGRRIVEPGTIELWVGPSCAERETSAAIEVTGAVHVVGPDDPRVTAVEVRAGVPAG